MSSSTRLEKQPSISIQEWRFVWVVIVLVLVLTSLPYLYGRWSAPPDKQFMGLMLNVADHGQYLSWWRSFQSAWLVSNKLTPEPNEPLFFNLLWWTLAQVSRWTGLGYAPVFQAFRWVAGGSFLWALYRLLALLLPQIERRRAAFLLTAFGAGFGWVLIGLKYTLTGGELLYPLDVYIAEGNSFLCILAFPHFTLALTMITLIFEFVWRGWREARNAYMVVAGVLALLLGWTHTYDLLIVYGVIGAFALAIWLRDRAFPWRLLWGGLIVGLLSCSGAIYAFVLTTVDPLWQEVLAQFANAGVYTPAPPHLAILFGAPLLAAIAAVIGLARGRRWDDATLFVVGWFLCGALLNYIPTDFQIHMLNSWQIPIMVLATVGACSATAPLLARRGIAARRLLAVGAALLVLPTNVYLYTWRFVELAQHAVPYYLYRDEVAALAWLDEHADDSEIVLSSLTVGQYVPALSGNTAFLAHWAQTVGFFDKQERVARFFDAATADEERAETVRTFDVGYVFHGPAEWALGSHDPATTAWLEPVYANARVSIYRVDVDALPPSQVEGGW